MTFRDLDDFLVVEPITLPIRGKLYSFPGEVTGRAGLLLVRIANAAGAARAAGEDGVSQETLDREILTDGEEVDLYAEVIGPAAQEMLNDGLSSAHVRHVFLTLVVWHTAGREAAEIAWENVNGGPKAPPANRSTRRAAARSTPKQGSANGTKPKPRKAAPRGPTSSKRGS